MGDKMDRGVSHPCHRLAVILTMIFDTVWRSIRQCCQVITVTKEGLMMALFPKSTIKPQLPQPQVTVTLGAF